MESSTRIGLEAGYAGLLAHKVGDGFALAAAEAQGPAAMVAIGAHTVPVVAFVVLAFGDARGRRAGLLRALWLALASIGGILSYRAVPPDTLAALAPVFDSLVGGLLLHVVAHELGHDLPETRGARALDIGAAALGLALIAASAGLGATHGHGHEAHDAPHELGSALLRFCATSAPTLLLAILAGALVRTLAPRQLAVPGSRSPSAQAASGLWRALPSSLCSCRVLPAARELRTAGLAFTSAFVLGAPALSLEVLVLTTGLFGVPFALGRAAAGALLAVLVALVVASLSRPDPARPHRELRLFPVHTITASPGARSSSGLRTGIAETSHELARQVFHVSAWVLIGLLLGGQILAFVPPLSLSSPVAQAIGLGVVALLVRPCLPAAVLVAAALAAKGFAPGALLAALVLAPTLGHAGLSFYLHHGTRAALTSISLSMIVALVFGLGLDRGGWLPVEGALVPSEPGPISWAALIALSAIAMYGPLRAGVRGWLAAAFELDHGAPRGAPPACGCRSHAARIVSR